jgi:DNA-binding response OmpR family regulator
MEDETAILELGTCILEQRGYTSDILHQNGDLESGIHFLEKPFAASNLARKVREIIDQNRYPVSEMS